MRYITAYITLLQEAFEDIVHTFESDTSRSFLITTAVLTPIFGSLFFFAVLVNAAEYIAPTPTVSIEAAVLDETTIAVNLRNNTTLLNAIEVELNFDPTHIYVHELLIGPELCEERFVITKEINNETGTVFYQCGTISPFAGTSTTLAILSVTPLLVGTSTIHFGNNTNALAHDGYGSNVTKERTGSIFDTRG